MASSWTMRGTARLARASSATAILPTHAQAKACTRSGTATGAPPPAPISDRPARPWTSTAGRGQWVGK